MYFLGGVTLRQPSTELRQGFINHARAGGHLCAVKKITRMYIGGELRVKYKKKRACMGVLSIQLYTVLECTNFY